MKKLPDNTVVLGVDPGNTTGWALIQVSTGVPLIRKQTAGNKESSDFLRLLAGIIKNDDYYLYAIIMEDYRIFSHKAKQHIGSDVPAAQIIGMVEHQASLMDVQVIKQPANKLPIAQKLVGVKMPGDHSKSHWVSAYLHACYWLIANDYMLSAAQRAQRDESS